MTKILYGTDVSKAMDIELIAKTSKLAKKNIRPCLLLIRVGEKPDDIFYENGILKKAEKLGVSVKQIVLPEHVSFQELRELIEEGNEDDSVNGIMSFFPLPGELKNRDQDVRNLICPSKDVDCLSALANANVYFCSEGFAPCTAEACMNLLEYYSIDVEGKKVVVAGRSLVLGKPLSMLMLKKNATVTICHSKTQNIENELKNADIVVSAIGKLKAFGRECFKSGQIVLDVGMNWDESSNTFSGDVDFEPVSEIVDAITPVPRGIGSITTSVLLSHVITSAEHRGE